MRPIRMRSSAAAVDVATASGRFGEISRWEVPHGYSDGDIAAGVRAGVSASPLWVDPGCFRSPWGRFSHYQRFVRPPSRVLMYSMDDVVCDRVRLSRLKGLGRLL